MTTWILVLALTSYRASALTTVPGFESAEACVRAGEQWQAHMRKSDSAAHAFCMPQRQGVRA